MNAELDYLTEQRLINVPTQELNHIGWDKERRCYTLPIYVDDELVNLRRYYRHQTPKMRGLTGRSIQLYPNVPYSEFYPFAGTWYLLCEGEWDALVANSHGFPALTSTGGACGWLAGWDDYFINKDVAIIYDCDEVGRREAVKRGRMLATVAKRVKVVDLAPDRDDGFDLSDWFTSGRTHAELLQLIRSVAPLGRDGKGGR